MSPQEEGLILGEAATQQGELILLQMRILQQGDDSNRELEPEDNIHEVPTIRHSIRQSLSQPQAKVQAPNNHN